MNELFEDDVEFSRDFFIDCIDILKKRNNKKYDFIIKAGNSSHFLSTSEDKPEH